MKPPLLTHSISPIDTDLRQKIQRYCNKIASSDLIARRAPLMLPIMVEATKASFHYKRASDEYFDGSRRYVEKQTGLMVVNVHAGDCFVTDDENEVGATVLGSCISACIRDPIAKVGGMNHFLLPQSGDSGADSARFGAFAMEQLINEIFKRGGIRSRLEAKLFGGGNVIKSSALIGDRNAKFAIDYLKQEGIALLGKDVGDIWPRKVRYSPVTGKAMIRKLQRDDDYRNVAREEEGYQRTIIKPLAAGNDVDLF